MEGVEPGGPHRAWRRDDHGTVRRGALKRLGDLAAKSRAVARLERGIAGDVVCFETIGEPPE